MSEESEGWLVGVDGFRSGWVAAIRESRHAAIRLEAFPTFTALIAALPKGSTVMVDVPIGLSEVTEAGGRSTERYSRRFLGRRASSMFSTPSRRALSAPSHGEACRQVATELPGRTGISLQSWGIFPKIAEVDRYFGDPNASVVVKETHPEVVFTVLNGGEALNASKKTADGFAERMRLLEADGLNAAEVIRIPLKSVSRDDKVDAVACLAAAIRFSEGRARAFDDGDVKLDAQGREQAIWA